MAYEFENKIIVRLDNAQHLRLKDVAAHLGVTVQSFTRDALKVALYRFGNAELPPAERNVIRSIAARSNDARRPRSLSKAARKRRGELPRYGKPGRPRKEEQAAWERYCTYFKTVRKQPIDNVPLSFSDWQALMSERQSH